MAVYVRQLSPFLPPTFFPFWIGSSSEDSYCSALEENEPVWVESGTIGQGGFGKVTLWNNTVSQYVYNVYILESC